MSARSDFTFFHTHRVRWSEVDPQAIVFNANYFVFIDHAVTEYFRATGMMWQQTKEQGFDFFTVNANCNFRSPARLDELIGQRVDEQLLLLTLEGSLGIEASSRLQKILESWEARLVRLKLDSRVTIAPSDDEIVALTQRAEDPLIAAVARELVCRCQGETEDATVARLALRELHTALV